MSEYSEETSVVEAVAALARSSLKEFQSADGRTLIVARRPSGGIDIEPVPDQTWLPPAPLLLIAAPVFDTQASLSDYANAFKRPESRLFADVDKANIRAVFDYHVGGADSAAGRCLHHAVYQLKLSEEWQRWSKISGQLMGQAEFVAFLEENACDIEAPSGADILEIARDFSAARKVDFTQTLRTDTGDISFEYVAQAESRTKAGAVEVPSKFRLRLAVFYGEPTTEVHAFLRWNINDGSLKMGIELHRPVFVKQALFEDIARNVSLSTGLPLHFGRVHGSSSGIENERG